MQVCVGFVSKLILSKVTDTLMCSSIDCRYVRMPWGLLFFVPFYVVWNSEWSVY